MDAIQPTRTNQGAALSRDATRAAHAESGQQREIDAGERARRAETEQGEARDSRLRLEQQARVERARAEETHLEKRRAEQASVVPESTLAVRTGLAPVEDLVDRAAEEALRETLNERARLVNLDPVMAMPEDDAATSDADAPRAELMGDGSRELQDIPLMGDGSSAPEMPPLMGEGRAERVEQTAEPRRPFEGDPEVAEARRAERLADAFARLERDVQLETVEPARELERADEPERAERAAAVAPQAAPLPSSGDVEPRSASSDAPEERRASNAVARASLTLGGLVEAEAGDEIVTRFIDGLPASQAGPEPSPAEHLGQRSTPPRE